MNRHLLTATFRANPSYRLTSLDEMLDELPAEQRESLQELRDDPDFHALLLPTAGSAMAVKAACQRSAALFDLLQQAGSLPPPLRLSSDPDTAAEIAQLVMDGVLEISEDGRWLSGPEALAVLGPSTVAPEPTYGRVARLSIDALRYGESLQIDDATVLAARLYHFNTFPAAPRWRRRFGSAEAVKRALGLGPGDRNTWLITRHWRPVELPPEEDAWLLWRARGIRSLGSQSGDPRMHKLYVSPHPDHLPEVFSACVETLTRLRCPSFKVGKDLGGLLRPDKLVAYFDSRDLLMETAGDLLRLLEGSAAQGVPFTAELGGDGLLSWGIDPPASERTPGPMGGESWRLWVAHRLAAALLLARAARQRASEETARELAAPWRFAVERIRLEGIDPETWAPAASLWSETGSESPSQPEQEDDEDDTLEYAQ